MELLKWYCNKWINWKGKEDIISENCRIISSFLDKQYSLKVSYVPEHEILVLIILSTGADQGFLERGFISIKVWVVRFADFITFFLNIPWKWNNFVSLRPNYFPFHRIFKNGGGKGGSSESPEPPLDPPLVKQQIQHICTHLYLLFDQWWIQRGFARTPLPALIFKNPMNPLSRNPGFAPVDTTSG